VIGSDVASRENRQGIPLTYANGVFFYVNLFYTQQKVSFVEFNYLKGENSK
jgi:hypothetical protein